MGQQPLARLFAEADDIERRTVAEGLQRANGVDTAEKAAQPFERAGLVELRGAARLTRENGEAKTLVRVQRLAVGDKWRHGRNLTRGEFGGESVFFEDGGIRPAIGSVELGDD